MKVAVWTSSFELKPTHSLCSHIFYNILKYSKHILEIEATVYKTFPAEIIDGPASAFFLEQTGPFLHKIKDKTKKVATSFCAALPFKSLESTSCLHLLSFIKYKLLKNIQMFVN